MLRTGPYGDGFGADPDGLTLDVLERTRTAIDLGPLEPRLPEVLRTPRGKIELAPEPIVADVDRLRARRSTAQRNGGLVLVGRRDLRSNNSWMHNVDVLVKGKRALHAARPPGRRARGSAWPTARRRACARGAATIERAGRGDRRDHAGRREHPARLGPRRPTARRCGVAAAHAGVEQQPARRRARWSTPLSGNAVLNGIPVEVTAVRSAVPEPVAK